MRCTSDPFWWGLLNDCGQSEIVIIGSELTLVQIGLIEQYNYILAIPSVSFVVAYQLWTWAMRVGRTTSSEVSSSRSAAPGGCVDPRGVGGTARGISLDAAAEAEDAQRGDELFVEG